MYADGRAAMHDEAAPVTETEAVQWPIKHPLIGEQFWHSIDLG
jgi:hypothetical protein